VSKHSPTSKVKISIAAHLNHRCPETGKERCLNTDADVTGDERQPDALAKAR